MRLLQLAVLLPAELSNDGTPLAQDGVVVRLCKVQFAPLRGRVGAMAMALLHTAVCRHERGGARTLNTCSRNSCMAAGSMKLPNLGRAML